jgi:hypothetical protein
MLRKLRFLMIANNRRQQPSPTTVANNRRQQPLPEQWLLIEWPKQAAHPTKYWLGNLAADTSLATLVATAKRRWIIERDDEELKQELGLGHDEGRGWRGFHHYATLYLGCLGLGWLGFGGWVLVVGHCRLRLSDRGAKPSFPRGPRWTAPTCPTRSSTRREAARGRHNAITPSRLPLCASWSPECWQGCFPVARFVALHVDNTVVQVPTWLFGQKVYRVGVAGRESSTTTPLMLIPVPVGRGKQGKAHWEDEMRLPGARRSGLTILSRLVGPFELYEAMRSSVRVVVRVGFRVVVRVVVPISGMAPTGMT